jgi:hypothetical protein
MKHSARVEAVIAALLAGLSLNETCELAHVSRSSLWRLRRNEEFQRRFDAARHAALESAVNALHDGAVGFVRTLRAVADDPKGRGHERAMAADRGLTALFKAHELFSIEGRLRRLEAVANEGRR